MNAQRQQRSKRRSGPKGAARSQRQPIQSNELDPKETNGPEFPPEYKRVVTTTARFSYIPGTISPWTPYDILVNVPGNQPTISTGPPPYWTWMRLQKISVFSVGTGSGGAITTAVSFPGTPFKFARVGVQGSVPAALHVRPPLKLLEEWSSGSDSTTQLFSVDNVSGLNTNVLILLTVELMSNQL